MSGGRRGWGRGAALATLVALVGLGCPRHASRLPPKPDGASVVLAPAETAGEAGFAMVDEVEPNDVMAKAQALAPTPELGAGVVGRLATSPGTKARDVDLFRVTIPPPAVIETGPDGATVPPPPQQLRIEVRPDPGLALAVDVLDEQGKSFIASSGSAAGEVQGIPNLAVTPGGPPVLIRVRSTSTPAAAPAPDGGAPPTTGYRLTVRLSAFGPGDETEPNGKSAVANDANLDGDVAGYLGWRHDEDWFKVPTAGMPEGGVLSAELDAIEGVAASLAVYDSSQHKMIEQHGRRGDRVALRNVRLPAADPNVYVVVGADSGRNLDARYMLHLKSEEAKSDGEIEPNDDPAHAVPLADGTVTGTLGPGDSDVYRYAASAPTELDLTVQPPPHVDVKVDVLREDGTAIMRVDAGKRGAAERLPNLYVSGSLLFRLQASKGEGNLDEPYRVTATGRPIEDGAEREPNGTAAQATPVAVGTAGTGLIFPRGDVDFWSVAGPATAGGGAPEAVSISLRGIAGMTLDVRVRGTAGARELARFRAGAEGAAPTRISRGADGCCLIEVREATGKAANPKDRYTLTVSP